nr:MAG TPA: hypothetical protein [Caudoviricetes sp.]
MDSHFTLTLADVVFILSVFTILHYSLLSCFLRFYSEERERRENIDRQHIDRSYKE